MEHVPRRNKNHLQKPQHRNYLGITFMIVKPKMIDDCVNRCDGIFWSDTREFLDRQIIITRLWVVRSGV